MCRAGLADPNAFGAELDSYLKGMWFIRNRMLHDFYRLNKIELLLWDSWGLMDYSREEPTEAENKLLDKIAGLTQAGDKSFCEMRALIENEDTLKLPSKIMCHSPATGQKEVRLEI